MFKQLYNNFTLNTFITRNIRLPFIKGIAIYDIKLFYSLKHLTLITFEQSTQGDQNLTFSN